MKELWLQDVAVKAAPPSCLETGLMEGLCLATQH